jgi:hypothetical protein
VGRVRQGVYLSGLVAAAVLGLLWRVEAPSAAPPETVAALNVPIGGINPAAHARLTCPARRPIPTLMAPAQASYLNRPTASAGAVFEAFIEHELSGIPVSRFETSLADERTVRYVLGHSVRTQLVVTLARDDGLRYGWQVVGVARCASVMEYRDAT